MSATQALRSVVLLPGWARAGIERDVRRLCKRHPGCETAGLLILTESGFSRATGPGPSASHTIDRCEWDAEYIARQIIVTRELGSTILGRWHKHTAPILLASETDKESARAFLLATGLPEMLDLIVACDEHDRPIGWAIYVCTPEEYRRAELEWSEA